MLRRSRVLCIFLIAVCLSLLAWQEARMQSPLLRVTNTSEEGISLNPSLSGDGRVLAFESTEDITHAGGAESFRVISADVSTNPATFKQIGVTRAPAPAMSQDGSRIAFASKDDPLGTNADGNSEIFLFDGAKLVQITNTSPGELANRVVNGNFQPSISDDGRYVAFSSNRQFGDQNGDGNLEIYVYDVIAQTFAQLTNTAGVVGCSDPKISGNGERVAYIYDSTGGGSTTRSLFVQNKNGLTPGIAIAHDLPFLALTYGRAISDDGRRVVWSAQTAANTTQVFLFDGRSGNAVRQITTLGSRVTEVALHPTISGDGSRLAFTTRRTVSGAGSNSDGSVELYTYDIPSSTFGRVTNVASSSATAEVVSSLSDDGTVIAFNFPRILSEPSTNSDFANNSEIYLSGTPARPAFGPLSALNGASFGHEPSATKAVAPDSIAVALGSNLANITQQTGRQADDTFPTNVNGTTVNVNGRAAQIFFVSPTQINFLMPAAAEIGSAEVIVTNPDGFPSRATVTSLRAAPGIFTFSGDGTGDGVILDANTLQRGPFDPTGGNLRLIVFATGVRNAASVLASAGGRSLTIESFLPTPNMPGMDEIHMFVPADLRGAGEVELVVRADGRDSNPVSVEFQGDSRRDVMINEFLADPPDGAAGDANHDGLRDSADDEFIELVNTTSQDIDLFGYRILTRSSGATSDTVRHEFVAGYILPACTSLVLFGGGNPDPNDPIFLGAQVYRTQTGSLSLTNSGGLITLSDRAGVTVDSVAYGGAGGIDGNANQSLTRAPDITGRFTLHQSASGSASRLFSPGTRLDGSPFALCSPISRIDISPLAPNIEVGQQQQFTARAFDVSGNEISGVIFLWTSGNLSVAGIDENGMATGVTPGMTEIRASGRGVTSPPVTLTVNAPAPVLSIVTISPTTARIGAGETQQYTAQAKDQLGQDIGGATISFTSGNTTVATVDSVSATSGTGSAIATITGRGNGTAQITATADNGSMTVSSAPATLTVEPGTGQLLISEFRTRGPNGAADEFIEIYNPTTSALEIGGLKIRASNNAGTVSDRATISAGIVLGSGCHYLVANGGGYSGAVMPNQTFATAIADDGGIAITGSNGTTIIDAVGMSNSSAYKEGTPLSPLSANVDQSYERKPGGTFGNGTDTNNNTADFMLNPAISTPQNAASACLDLTTADLIISKSDSPDPVTTGSDVTYKIVIANNGAADAHAVVVTDNLPSSVNFVSCASSAGGACGGSGNDRSVTFSTIPSGGLAAITLVATANGAPGSVVTNTASISSSTPDPITSNNSATTTTTIQAPLPDLSINDVALTEADSGINTVHFSVTLLPSSTQTVTVNYRTVDNTAVAPSDYQTTTGTLTFMPGQTTQTIDVPVNGDTNNEASCETFSVNLNTSLNAVLSDSQGICSITDNDGTKLVISQIYGGGGNAGATYTNDFIEIFNRGNTAVSLNGMSVQYSAATSTSGSFSVTALPNVALQPGQYFLIQEGSGGASGLPLPAPDATGSINMAASTGKVALVNSTVALSAVGCPSGPTVIDFVGYGATANCREGSTTANNAAGPSNNTTSIQRKSAGCQDVNNNQQDFATTAVNPHNGASPASQCTCSDSYSSMLKLTGDWLNDEMTELIFNKRVRRPRLLILSDNASNGA